MVRTWPAREILALADRLPPPHASGLGLGLAVLRAQAEVESAPAPVVRAEEARDRLARGVPVLSGAWLASVARGDRFRSLVARLREVLASARLEVGDLHGDDGERFLLAQAGRGVLRAAAIGVGPLTAGAPWRRGRCPVCGGAPDLGSITAEGERRLLCARCDAEWDYVRVACPFCDDEEPRHLGYHPAGTGDAYRLYVCANCTRYLKTVDRRRRPEACPPLERLLTLGLDAAALAAGYTAAVG